jgi:hypothetical protein
MTRTLRLCAAAFLLCSAGAMTSCGSFSTEPDTGYPDYSGGSGALGGSGGQSGASGSSAGGNAGSLGTAGASGASGNGGGASGNTGASGNAGATGNTGAAGNGGASGNAGVSGNAGATGSAGAAGNAGAAGSGAVGPGGSSGASGAGGTSGSQATFAAVQTVITSQCASCHRTRAPVLSTTGATLYNTLTTRTVRGCGGDRLVVPNDPDNSALVGITEGTCTPRMPRGCPNGRPCLTTAETQTFRSWIAAGAPGP